jgi:uncharacterized Zn-finger protein
MMFKGCKWSFSTASKLRRHSQKHTDERNFKCPVDGCPKAFLRPEHLREHILTHEGTKNWECPVQGTNQLRLTVGRLLKCVDDFRL